MATKKRKPVGAKAAFIESMECLPVTKLPEGSQWSYEIKLDGYQLAAVKNACKTTLYSRRRDVLNDKFGYIAEALEDLPDGTVLGGEIVTMHAAGKSDFNLLQNFRSAELNKLNIHYYVFDIRRCGGVAIGSDCRDGAGFGIAGDAIGISVLCNLRA